MFFFQFSLFQFGLKAEINKLVRALSTTHEFTPINKRNEHNRQESTVEKGGVGKKVSVSCHEDADRKKSNREPE